MRISSLKNLPDGAVLARPIFDESMHLLVNKGIVLNLELMNKLQGRGFKYIYIQEDGTEEIEIEEPVSLDVSRRVAAEMDNTFYQMRKISPAEKTTLKAVADRLTLNDKFQHLAPKGSFRKNVIKMVEDIFYRNKPTIGSFSLSMLGTNPLSHAMDVTILSILLGKRFHYELKSLISLATVSLLHDCGMQFTPEICDKPSHLYDKDEKQMYFRHPRIGYEALEYLKGFSPVETQTVLQHHENQDGSGFPTGLKGDNEPPYDNRRGKRGHIFRWAEIITVVDRYINYCSGDLTEIPVAPPKAITTLIQESGTILNSAIVKEFNKILNVFPKGAMVKVADARDSAIIGYEGVVSKENPAYMDRPQIILLRSKKGTKLKPTLVDLSKDKNARLELLLS